MTNVLSNARHGNISNKEALDAAIHYSTGFKYRRLTQKRDSELVRV